MRLLIATPLFIIGTLLVIQSHWLAQSIGILLCAVAFLLLASYPIGDKKKH